MEGYAMVVYDKPSKSRKSGNIGNVHLIALYDGGITAPNYDAWKDDQFVPIDSLTFTMNVDA
jgi:hypothetical protein